MKNNMQGVYSIKNNSTGQLYIGSAINIENRFKVHKKELKKGIHANSRMQNSWNKYGEDYFTFRAEELVEDKQNLIEVEQQWLDVLWKEFDLYNICPTAGSCLGRKFSSESKKRMSLSHMGKIAPMLGKHHTEETKNRLSISAKRQWDEIRKGTKRLGQRVVSKETKERQSQVKKGKILSLQHRENMACAAREAWKLRKESGTAVCSSEQKKKISLAKKGKTLSDSTRDKMAKAQKMRRLLEKEKLTNETV